MMTPLVRRRSLPDLEAKLEAIDADIAAHPLASEKIKKAHRIVETHGGLDELNDELFPLWRLVAYSGMRRSEALALKWSDINTKTMRISIRRAVNTEDWSQTKTTKTGNARVIDMDAETLKVLASYKVARAELSFELAKADAYVFAHDDGKLRSPDAMTSRWDRRLKGATAKFDTLHRVTLKGLRHTHATLRLEMGVHPNRGRR